MNAGEITLKVMLDLSNLFQGSTKVVDILNTIEASAKSPCSAFDKSAASRRYFS